MEDKIILGNFISLHRQLKGMKSAQLARLCNYSRSYICQIESGKLGVSPEAYTIIFKVLGLSYTDYIYNNNTYIKDIEALHKSVLAYEKERAHLLFTQLNNCEDDIKTHQCYMHYLLVKFEYLVIMEAMSEIPPLIKLLDENIGLYTDFEKQAFYTYYGVLCRQQYNLKDSLYYLLKAKEIGEFKQMTAITFYHLSLTCELRNDLVLSYLYNAKAEQKFLEEVSVKGYIFTRMQQANIFASDKKFKMAKDQYYTIIKNYSPDTFVKNEIILKIALVDIECEEYTLALTNLKSIQNKSDTVKYYTLVCLAKVDKLEEFHRFYQMYVQEVSDEIVKFELVILKYKIEHKDESEEYINLLLNLLELISGNVDYRIIVQVLDDIIDFYKKEMKYKKVCHYLMKKNSLFEQH